MIHPVVTRETDREMPESAPAPTPSAAPPLITPRYLYRLACWRGECALIALLRWLFSEAVTDILCWVSILAMCWLMLYWLNR